MKNLSNTSAGPEWRSPERHWKTQQSGVLENATPDFGNLKNRDLHGKSSLTGASNPEAQFRF